VTKLRDEIQKILGLGKKYNAVILGAGNIGQALINYLGFEKEGYNIVALFDVSEKLIGSELHGKKVYHMNALGDFLQAKQVDIGFICTPKEAAQQAANLLMDNGVKAIWNFAPMDVTVQKGVKLENVHLSDSLYVLCYRINNETEE
jgi:redox-sensing transcriptional repressor